MDKILIVEDDKAILMGLTDDLEFEGYEVAVALDGKKGLKQALEQEFQLIILDILLPELNGFEVCKKLREAGKNTPILMLTAARTEEMDKVLGLDIGADDYVTKPIGSREMVARVKAILRRTRQRERIGEIYEFGDISINFKSHEVLKSGKRLSLTALEFKLLKFFIEHKGEVVTRDTILDEAWDDAIVSPRTIDPHIVHLRKKIENDPSNPEYIISVRGVGYKFKE
ncbi:MAG: response regulator transcription factor [Candidatus Aminicenantes bacterium]|nr:MAG: response regulator transcription factor [Candidatus Aminicenantes bacterium]